MTTLITPETMTPVRIPMNLPAELPNTVTKQTGAIPAIPVPIPADYNAVNVSQTPRRELQQRLQLLGAITWLMLRSPLHRSYTVAELEERILPSLMLNQFRYYEVGGQPVGFLNWAWLTEDIETHYQTGDYELSPQEWQGGDSLWYPEFIAPFGHARYIVKDIRQNVFRKGTPAKALRVDAEGNFRSIAKYTL